MSTPIESLEPYPRALARAVLARYATWLRQRAVDIASRSAITMSDSSLAAIELTANNAQLLLTEQLSRLLATDVDEQRRNPLQLIRESTAPMNDVLRSFGVPEPHRDEFERRSMPTDVYAIGPLTWRDLGDDVHDAGIEWGAWKAATVLTRRRAEGKLDE